MTILWPNGSTTPPPFSWQGHFGWRNADLSYASRYHRGQDFYGFSTVRAIADGTVVHVGRRSGWAGGGYMVWIQHAGVFSRSLHLAEGSAVVTVGQRVRGGDPIATMGATNGGGVAMAVHLHLEITPGQWHAYNSGQIDPRAWLEANVGGTGGGGGSADYDYDGLELDMSAQQDIEWIKERLGGSIADGGSVTKEIRQLQADVAWLKDRIGGTSKTDSVTDFLRGIKG